METHELGKAVAWVTWISKKETFENTSLEDFWNEKGKLFKVLTNSI